MPNRVILLGSAFASPIGNSSAQALAALREGRCAIERLDESCAFLPTGALLRPVGTERQSFHPRLSARFESALTAFCREVALLVAECPALEEVYLICKQPFYSKWPLPESLPCWEESFQETLLERMGVTVPQARVILLQASCSSGIVALNLAIRELARHPGRQTLLLGIEAELHAERFLALQKLGALSSEKDPRRSCQPFSSGRSGLVAGEVLVALLLGSQEKGQAGEIAFTAGDTTSDAFRLTDGLESGEFLERCLAETLSGHSLDELDFLCPHGTSTPLNDRLEGAVLERFFASRAVPLPLVPFKRYFGHTLNSSGLIETALSADLLRAGFLPPLGNPDPQDPYEHLEFVDNPRTRDLRKALKLSIGFGGINSAVLLEKLSG